MRRERGEEGRRRGLITGKEQSWLCEERHGTPGGVQVPFSRLAGDTIRRGPAPGWPASTYPA